jgi:methanogenic corrinoid protein MtbC1
MLVIIYFDWFGKPEDLRAHADVKVVVGGAPVTEKWATEIGADACGYDADNAISVALRLMEEVRVDA